MAKITYPNKSTGDQFKATEANEIKDSVNSLYDNQSNGFINNQNSSIQDAKFSIGGSAHIGGYGLTQSFVSPQITGHQGYITDGTFHYITDTARIDKRNNDGSWSVALSNTTPFAGVSGVNHLGDVDYYNGKLYVTAETYGGCGSVSGQKVVIYNSTTLALDSQFDISAQGHEASSIAIDGANNIAYISSYCDGTKLWKYNATTFVFIGTITLSKTIGTIQGLAFYNDQLFIASETEGLYTYNISNGSMNFVKAIQNNWLIPEGIAVVNGQVRWLIDNVGDGTNSNVYYLDQGTTPVGFYTDSLGTSYFSNKLQINSTSLFGALNTSNKNPTQLFANSPNNSGTFSHDDSATSISRNAIFEGGWARTNIAKNSFAFLLGENTNRFEFRFALAGANPLVWTTPLVINPSGKIIINNTTEGVFNGTGFHTTEQTLVIKNTNPTSATALVAFNDTGSAILSVGVVNSASTIGNQYGLIGEGFIRSSTSSTGMNFSCVTGPMRFTMGSSALEAMRIFNATRNISIGTTADNGFKLDVNGTVRSTQYNISSLNTAPATATSTGTTGEIRYTSTHIYLCTATNTWVRAALTTF